MTLTDLAREAQCSVPHLSRIESGERQAPSTALLERLADALGVQPGIVFSAAGVLTPKVVSALASAEFGLAVGDGYELPLPTGWVLRRRHIAELVAREFPEPPRGPIRPSELAEARGFEVTMADGKPWSEIDGSRLSCKGNSDPSRRFIIAHALGHVVLETEPECEFGSFSPSELDATAFAGFLLAPPRLLKAVLSPLGASFDVWGEGTGSLLEATAKSLGVPTWLVARRAAEDGLLAELADVGDL